MNIGFFTDTYFPQINGVTYTLSMWKRELEKKDNRVQIYYPKSEYMPEKNEFALKSFEFPFYKEYNVAFPLVKGAKDLDIVHIHGLFSLAIAGLYTSRRYKLPKILTYHTPADEYISYMTRKKSIKNALIKTYNRWEKRLLNSCDVITVPSSVIKERLKEKGIEDAIILSNGLDLDFFKPVTTKNFRDKYKIQGGKVIGFCGRHGYEKHLEDLIRVADDFNGDILIAGSGPAHRHYKKLAAQKKNVRFLGFLDREDLPAFYSCLDVFVFPSTVETQGLTALEAMACGTPVVGANELALKKTIKDGKTGYLYESGDIPELIQKIEICYDEKENLSKDCLDYVKRHSVEKTVEKLLDIYQNLLG